MKNKNRLLKILCLLLLVLVLSGCSRGEPQGTENDAGEVSICDLCEDLIGWRVTTTGKISFVDLSPPDGVYFEFRGDGCQGGGFIHNDFWNDFSQEEKDQVGLDNMITVEGILTRNEGRYIASMQKLIGPQ
jgi:hypothetical protein